MKIDNEPLNIIFNMDKFYDRGVKSLYITVNGNEYIFSKDEIEYILKKLYANL